MSRAQAATAFAAVASAVPVLRAPQRSSSHTHAHQQAWSLSRSVTSQGWVAMSSHYREHIQHLSCSFAWAESSQPDSSNSCTLGNSRQGKKTPYTSSSSLAEVTSTTCSDTQCDASAGGVSPEHSLGLGFPSNLCAMRSLRLSGTCGCHGTDREKQTLLLTVACENF